MKFWRVEELVVRRLIRDTTPFVSIDRAFAVEVANVVGEEVAI